jgi:hypothetical protein
MNAELNLKEILSQVKKLDKPAQMTLLKRIKSMLQKQDLSNKPVALSEISGLGSSVWRDVNIDQYVDSERQW